MNPETSEEEFRELCFSRPSSHSSLELAEARNRFRICGLIDTDHDRCFIGKAENQWEKSALLHRHCASQFSYSFLRTKQTGRPP
eukprot:2148593-Amphidinium_carterae.1